MTGPCIARRVKGWLYFIVDLEHGPHGYGEVLYSERRAINDKRHDGWIVLSTGRRYPANVASKPIIHPVQPANVELYQDDNRMIIALRDMGNEVELLILERAT